MKKFLTRFILIFIMPIMFFELKIMGQEIECVDSSMWIEVISKDAIPINDGIPITDNKNLNLIFDDFNVNYYGKPFPGAKHEILKSLYKISCDCKVDSLLAILQHGEFKNLFGLYKKFEYVNTSLYDPVDWMWIYNDGEWLWHLNKKSRLVRRGILLKEMRILFLL